MEDMIEIADNNATTVMPPVDYSGITRTDKDDDNTIQVEKRDGRIVDFDKENIINAIMRAYKEVNHEIAAQDIDDIETIANEIEGDVKRKYAARPIEINEIQNLVEQSLLDDHKYDVATAYKDYRWKKDIQRAKQTDANEAVKRFMRKDKSIVNENANKDSRIYSTQRDLLAGTISKSAALSILPKDVANAYEKCDIHFHDADYSPFTAMSNCLARETRFITSKGIKSFEDFKDGDVVSVLAPSGKFQKAIVHNYGRQSLNEITFIRNGRTRRTIFATGNHRWILADGSETTELKEGDFIQYPPVHKPIDIENAPVNIMKAWVNGFIYGDGSERTLKNGNSICDLRLCGDKNDYIKVFEKLGYYPTYPQYAHGDATFYIRGFHKTPDIENMSTDEINAFFDGYMAADGAYTNNNNEYKATIMSSNKLDNFNIIENYSAIAGYHISSIKDMTGQITNYTDENGRKPTNIYRFIIGNHNKWKVESIKPSDRTEDVWCLEVDNEHAFVLDGGIVTGNCSLPNFKDMLKNGFALGNAEMASPNSIETAATQVTQIMLDVASSQYGGQTLNRADETLAPYAMKNYAKNLEMAKMVLPDGMDASQAAAIVRSLKASENSRLHCEGRPEIKDEPEPDITNELDKQRDLYAKILTRKNIYDAMQTLEYQINTQHATCGQTPFVTVGFGLGTSWASREITRCILLIRIGGLGKDHRTAIFPKLTYTIKHGINSETQDPNYDLKQLALECTSKRMYPDILFYENIVNITGSFKAPMGCRSFLQGWINPETGEDEEEGRFNLGVVTVNIPRIAIESKGNVKRFWKLFDERMNVAHHALQYRIKRCREALPENAPVLWENGAFGRLKPGDDVDSLMRNSRATLSLGYIGLYEATAMFYGRDWINNWGWDEDAYDFEISILKKMTNLCKEWEKDEGYHYSVYATPSESLTDRFSRADRAKFGRIPGITDHDFYTNSFHRPVWLSGNPEGTPSESIQEVMNRPHFHNANNGGAFSKLDFEEPFLKYTAGGHIVYTEEPMLVNNLRALEAVWDYAHEIGVDYLGTNTPIDSCMVCGYKGDFDPTETGYKCPQCGNDDPDKCDVVKRVCGYLGQPQQRKMVHGRHEELAHRAKHMDGETGVIRLADGTEELSFKDRAEKM